MPKRYSPTPSPPPDASATLRGLINVGTQSFAGAKTFSGSITLSGASGNTLVVDTSTFVVDATNNRVGVKTATPLQTLHVNGEGAFGDSVTASNAPRALNLCSTDAVMRMLRISADSDIAAPSFELLHRTTSDGSNTLWWDIFADSDGIHIRDRINEPTTYERLTLASSTGNMTVDGGTFIVDAANNKVGVNKTPSATFDVLGTIAASSTVTGSNLSGTNTGDITLGAFGSSPSATGASLSSQVLTLQPADATHPGLVSTGTQSFSGDKNFTGTVTASNLSGTITGTNTGDITLAAVGSSPAAEGASLSGQALTLQPADGTRPGLLTAGVQVIGGAKTFASTISASNLSGTNTGDITLGAIGSSPDAKGATLSGQVLTLQPADATHPGLLTSGSQAIGGDKTLSGVVTLSGSSGNVLVVDTNVLVADATNNRVGILTASPSQPLHVAGTIYSSTGGFKFPDGTTQTTAAVGAGGTIVFASASTTSAQTISTSGTPTVVEFGTTANDTVSGFSGSGTTFKYTCQTGYAGLYHVNSNLAIASGTNSSAQLALYKTPSGGASTLEKYGHFAINPLTSSSNNVSVHCYVVLAEGDAIQIKARQFDAVTRSTTTTTGQNYLQIMRVGDTPA